MTDSIAIRPAVDGDRDFVAGLVPSLLEFGSHAWKDVGALAPGFRRVLADAISRGDPNAAVFIAQAPDETPLGFISLQVREDIVGAPRAHVADVAVIEGARRTGVGRALMRAGEAWARQQGINVLSLDVWSTNERALAFYGRLGYRTESLCLIKALD
ncbi:MAG TPA: GNAT family N-acetyltransferase [Solirubrobacteraceae bacterium]|nr:GNAT family N-acetyltransferase [Solirubrobacteraceae bacterium]